MSGEGKAEGRLEVPGHISKDRPFRDLVFLFIELKLMLSKSFSWHIFGVRRLEYLDMATGLEDLKVPPGNRLHELQRERKGQYSISVNDQWRICFRFEDGDAYDVELTDYH